MKLIKMLLLMTMVGSLNAQSPEVPWEQRPNIGMWTKLRNWWTLRGSIQQRAAFMNQLAWSRHLVDMQHQIKKCEMNYECNKMLQSPDIQRAIEKHRAELTRWLQKSVNDILTAHGVNMYFNFEKSLDVADQNGNTALHYAMRTNIPPQIAVWLIENGANVNAKNNINGVTPLMLAVVGQRPELVTALLQGGADYTLQDSHRRTALTIARELVDADNVNKKVAKSIVSVLENARPLVKNVEFIEVEKPGFFYRLFHPWG